MDLSRITNRVSRRTWFLAAALLIAGAAALPLFSQSGLLNTRGGGDSPFLLQRLHQLVTALSDGHFPVRWMPDANYGYGYPFYNYYAPLSIYIAAAFRFLGFGYVQAIKLAQLTGFVVTGWAMFELGQRWFLSPWAGLLAAAAYTLAPFHLVNIYVRGDSLAEFWAMAFYPLVVLTFDHLFATVSSSQIRKEIAGSKSVRIGRQIPRRERMAIAIPALAFAGLVLSHNISALIFTPFVFLYVLFVWVLGQGKLKTSTGMLLNRPLLALILALALSAWFWLPAMGERSLAQLKPVISGYFHYSNHFRSSDLVQPSFLFDYNVAGGNAFRLGLVQMALALAGLIVLSVQSVRKRQPNLLGSKRPVLENKKYLYIVGGLIIATLMITPLSRPFWDNLPLLPFVQFPWRFLSILAFFAALATAGLALLPGRKVFVPILILLLFIAALGGLKTDFLSLTDADINPDRLALYEWFTGNIGSTVSAEYLPQTVQPRPYTSAWLNRGVRDAVQQLDGVISSSQLLDRKATRQSWQIDTQGSQSTITYPTMDWPDWLGSIGNIGLEVQPAPGSGLIESTVSSGEHIVELGLTRTPIRWAGELVSLAGFFAIIWLFWPKKPAFRSHRLRFQKAYLIILGVLLGLFIILRVLPDKVLSNSNLTWDFAQMAYLHHDDQGVPFENGALLGSYEYSAEEVRVGEELEITLYWEEGRGSEATLALATPAVNRFKLAPVLVTETHNPTGDRSSYKFELPENAPTGLYVPRLTVVGAQPLTPSGLKRGDLFLRPILVIDDLQPVDRDGPLLDARALRVTQRNPTTLDLKLQWATLKPLTQNYNFSLRLVDNLGTELDQFDGQPGYGFQPSSLWPAGVWVDDWLAFPLPEDLPKNPAMTPLALIVRLYDVGTGEVKLVRRLGDLNWQEDELVFQPIEPAFNLPAGISPTIVDFGENPLSPVIGLRGYSVDQQAGKLDLILYWLAVDPGNEDYSHFVHLIDTASGEILAQHDSMPRNNSYPTSQWMAGEIVTDPVQLDLSEVPAGQYELFVGLYQSLGDEIIRLPAVDNTDLVLPDDSYLLPENIVVK